MGVNETNTQFSKVAAFVIYTAVWTGWRLTTLVWIIDRSLNAPHRLTIPEDS